MSFPETTVLLVKFVLDATKQWFQRRLTAENVGENPVFFVKLSPNVIFNMSWGVVLKVFTKQFWLYKTSYRVCWEYSLAGLTDEFD